MEILNDNNVQVDVNACWPITMVSSVYKTKVLTPCIIDGTNIIKQSDLASANTKYVIRYNFDLIGEEITVPKGCIIEFDGGSIANGTLICNNTIISCQGDIKGYIDNVTLEGDYTISNGIDAKTAEVAEVAEVANGLADKANNTDGMGKIYLKKNKPIHEQMTQPNTIYVIQYDFDLGGKELNMPENCVLEFDGGMLKNGSVNFKKTFINGDKYNIFENIDVKGEIGNNTIYIHWFSLQRKEGTNEYICDFLDALCSSGNGHVIQFDSNAYIINTKSFNIRKGNILKGHDRSNTILKINISETNPKYYIGLTKGAAICDLYIEVNETRNIPIIYASSVLYEGNSLSDWNQTIENVNITNTAYFNSNSISGIETTAIKFNVSPYDINGNIIPASSYAFSYRGNYRNIQIKYFNVGIDLHIDDVENISTWCNSVYFDKLTIWCDKGFQSIGKPSGWTTITDYVFQRISGGNYSAAIYGRFRYLTLNNMVVWDTSFKGYAEGTIIDLAPSIWNTYQISGVPGGFNKLSENCSLQVYNNSPFSSGLSFISDGAVEWEATKINSILPYYGGIDIRFEHPIADRNDYVRRLLIQNNDDGLTFRLNEKDSWNNAFFRIKEDGSFLINDKYNRQYPLASYKIASNDEITKLAEGLVCQVGDYIGIINSGNLKKLAYAKNTYGGTRPSLNETDTNFQFFDTNLNKPIWWTGSKWVDATGADV